MLYNYYLIFYIYREGTRSNRRPSLRVAKGTGHIDHKQSSSDADNVGIRVLRLNDGRILTMWYVIWTATGSERKLNQWISDYVSDDLYEDCFVPLIEQNRKEDGKWKTVKKVLFPGYLFVKTDEERIKDFSQRLSRSGQFAVILSNDGAFAPVKREEEFLIDNAFNNSGVLGTSIGVIEGENIRILSGPLIGLEGAIKQINRHKRIAVIELNMFGRVSRVKIGLEIISKS